MESEKKIVFNIFGNIACGKSTVAKKLKKNGFIIYDEPIKEWEPYLKLYFSDKKRWGFLLQSKIMNSYSKLYKKINNYDIIIRSHESALNIFSKNLKSFEYINDLEYNVLKEHHDNIISPKFIYIYIKTNPLICYNRLKKRNIKFENSIELKYLNSINNHLINYTKKIKNIHIIDGNKNKNFIYDNIIKIINNYKIFK